MLRNHISPPPQNEAKMQNPDLKFPELKKNPAQPFEK